MADPNTIRILEFDGGGQRGYFSLTWFNKFVQTWGIDPATIWQQFDVICGACVGGITSLGLASGLTPTEILPLFETEGPFIFSLSSLIPSWRPNLATKIALILADIPFYQSSGPTQNLYGSGLLSTSVQGIFGSNTLQNLKTNVVVPAYQNDTNRFVLFSNVSNSRFIGQTALISDVGLATAAPPVYLPAWTFGGHTYIDGGIYQNNPSSFGIALGKILKPNSKRICVLSIGSGLGEIGFDPSGNEGIPLGNNPLATTSSSTTVVVTVPTTTILTNGQNVAISGATATGGIPAINLNITASISIINSTTFSYTATASATSTTTGGGTNVVLDYIDALMMRSSLKRSPFHPSGISYEQFKETPIYQKLLKNKPLIEEKIQSLSTQNAFAFDTIQAIFGLFEIASTGGQESVAESLLIQSLYTLDKLYYYRFNPVLDPTKNTELDNTDSTIMTYYHDTAISLFNADIDNITTFLGHLTA